MKRWSLDDIPWNRFDSSRVDPEILEVVKAAALVERNGSDYVTYLHGVFGDDEEFKHAASLWAEEEIQHGEALGRWAEMADPDFDFRDAFRRFVEGYRIPVDATASVRGSRTGELVARCVVETGTSSFYSCLRDATEEPVLKDICHRIAGDEFRHYKLFYDHMRRYAEREGVGRLRRTLVVLGRLREIEDDELPFAYYCGNHAPDEPYERRRCGRDYERRAFRRYRYPHVDKAARMALKAAGLPAKGRLGALAGRLLWREVRRRSGADMRAV